MLSEEELRIITVSLVSDKHKWIHLLDTQDDKYLGKHYEATREDIINKIMILNDIIRKLNPDSKIPTY